MSVTSLVGDASAGAGMMQRVLAGGLHLDTALAHANAALSDPDLVAGLNSVGTATLHVKSQYGDFVDRGLRFALMLPTAAADVQLLHPLVARSGIGPAAQAESLARLVQFSDAAHTTFARIPELPLLAATLEEARQAAHTAVFALEHGEEVPNLDFLARGTGPELLHLHAAPEGATISAIGAPPTHPDLEVVASSPDGDVSVARRDGKFLNASNGIGRPQLLSDTSRAAPTAEPAALHLVQAREALERAKTMLPSETVTAAFDAIETSVRTAHTAPTQDAPTTLTNSLNRIANVVDRQLEIMGTNVTVTNSANTAVAAVGANDVRDARLVIARAGRAVRELMASAIDAPAFATMTAGQRHALSVALTWGDQFTTAASRIAATTDEAPFIAPRTIKLPLAYRAARHIVDTRGSLTPAHAEALNAVRSSVEKLRASLAMPPLTEPRPLSLDAAAGAQPFAGSPTDLEELVANVLN